jgi:hypothetical protein
MQQYLGLPGHCWIRQPTQRLPEIDGPADQVAAIKGLFEVKWKGCDYVNGMQALFLLPRIKILG